MKAIISLTGSPELKNRFDRVIRGEENNWRYHRWNINSANPINSASRIILDAIGVKDENEVNKFTNVISSVVNKTLNFKETYIGNMIQKFNDYEKCQLLIFHGLGRELTNKLKTSGVLRVIHLADATETESNPLADVTIFGKDDFEQVVLDTLNSFEK